MTAAPNQLLDIVSDLARGRSVTDVAARHHVATAVVTAARNDYGPDLGKLAESAAKMRSGYLTITTPTEAPAPGVIDAIVAKAATKPAFAGRAAKIRDLVEQLDVDLGALEKREAAEKLVAAKRAELRKAEELLAATKGKKALVVDESTRIREWAKSQGITVGANGRVPQSVVDQYEAAQK